MVWGFVSGLQMRMAEDILWLIGTISASLSLPDPPQVVFRDDYGLRFRLLGLGRPALFT